MNWRHGARPTIGVLAGWQTFENARPNRFLERMFTGIRAAAHDLDFNLMLSCGVERLDAPGGKHAGWPVPSDEASFLPVGHLNTDGLVIVPPLWFESRTIYVNSLKEARFPLVFAGNEREGHSVVVDNAAGIHDAVAHLKGHGHERILFIAGETEESGDSFERLCAYRNAVKELHLVASSDLITYGYHTFTGGYQATLKALKHHTSFTAILASNDPSALGAYQALIEKGYRVPQDVALVGFDDQPAAEAHVPPLSSIRYPLHETGYELVRLLDRVMHDPLAAPFRTTIASQFIPRHTCGCFTSGVVAQGLNDLGASPSFTEVQETVTTALTGKRAHGPQALPVETEQMLCEHLVRGFLSSLQTDRTEDFQAALNDLIQKNDELDADPSPWQERITLMRTLMKPLLQPLSPETRELAAELFDTARIMLSDSARRRNNRRQAREDDHANYLSRLASQFLTSQKTADIIRLFHDSLGALDVRQAHVALFEASNLAAFGMYRLAPFGDEMSFSDKHFRSHHFPPTELCSDDRRFSLALLPLIDHDEQMGFVAFDAANLEPCASLVRQLSATFVHARRHEQVLDLSQRDGLTGLYNRRYLDAFLKSEIERCARYGTTVSVLLLDLDHFKSYNDTFGHLAGDEALRQLAATITKARRGTDVIARYGGEEFAVVLPETNLAGAKAVAEHIRADVMAMNWLMRPVTVSIGVAIAEDALTTPTALLQCADHALYASKTGGRNRVTVFHPPEEHLAAEPTPA